jgi:hypothetical protein
MPEVDQQTRLLKGDEARALLRDQIDQHSGGLHAALSGFDPTSAVEAWLETLRAVEEFINLALFGLDDDVVEAALVNLPVGALQSHPRRLRAVRHHIAYRYGDRFAARFTTLLIQAAAIGHSFALHGLWSAAAGFATVGTAVGYFQSRRRHLVAMLYTLPRACRGTRRMHPLDTLNQLLPLVELNGVTLTGLYQQLMLIEALKDFTLHVDQRGFQSSHDYPALDSFFLEPERASIVEMFAGLDDPRPASLENVRRDRLFSAAELRNDIRLLEAAYAEFDLAASAFAPAATMVRRLAERAVDDHWIQITSTDFVRLSDELNLPSALRRALVNPDADYVANTNSYAPFVEVAGTLRSSVTLLSRFLYYWKNVCLYRGRRFQIRSGFIFEKTVSEALERQGFRLTGIKRLNRKEFDVVTVRGGVIFNIQCKNNLIDPSRLEADPKLFARYNRARVASYERALRKETGREDLLTAELGLAHVEHLVVSRFPVATDNPRIVPFSRIEELSSVAADLAARLKS